MLEQREKQKEEQETLRKQRREARVKLERGPTSIKFRPNSPVASISKDAAIRCPACEEEYCDPPTEE
ncbi:UNVERIFIED_CONTAM: hypothetical protein NCL1_30748 [Trichonephila clavipes]